MSARHVSTSGFRLGRIAVLLLSLACAFPDLGVLRQSGEYTQLSRSSSLAGRRCELNDPEFTGLVDPPPGTALFVLVTGLSGGVEGSLGDNGAGIVRPNANPCRPLAP